MNLTRTYDELVRYSSFEDRFKYLRLDGRVGEETFGFERFLNQRFYHSEEWKRVRREVIIRDTGHSKHCCDLGVPGYEIFGRVYIHHMNPISVEDLDYGSDFLLNPRYLIAASFDTHNAIHYGTENLTIPNTVIERSPNDTCPWKR